MRVTVLGTGTVGRTLAGALDRLGHEVVVGTRDPAATAGRDELAAWSAERPSVALRAYGALEPAPVVVNATAGTASLDVLGLLPPGLLDGAVLVDVANPLDFSQGFPPRLSVVGDDSLAERLQRAAPAARVVKALNTVTASVMVDPASVPGEHHVFVAGDDAQARGTVAGLLHGLGWPEHRVLDLGGLRAARGLEAYLLLWLSLMQHAGHAELNVAVLARDSVSTGD